MALVQSEGDISFAAEILFQMNDKTMKAIKKIEKKKQKMRKHSNLNFNQVCYVSVSVSVTQNNK